jgi:histidinol-phosphate aminotransferase
MPTKPELKPYRRQTWNTGVLLLDANEGPSPGLPTEIWPLEDDSVRRYPDAGTLEADLARRFGVEPEQVLVTAGVDDAIDRACRLLLGPDRDLVLTEPTFGMFRRYSRLAGASVRSTSWWQGDYPVRGVAGLVDERTGLLAVVSPNNPTGAVITGEQLKQLRQECPDPVLLLDAAYMEFARQDLTNLALQLPRTLVMRTLSKAWGLAGLRVGYVLGPAELISRLRAWGQPFAVAGPSLALARRVLRDNATRVDQACQEMRRNRQELARFLTAQGVESLPSQGNFLLCRPQQPGFLARGLAALGVAVRSWPEGSELQDWVRITVPVDAQDLTTLRSALGTILAPQAILFDMDGVLADVQQSYRQCIIGVAARAGVSLEPAAIQQAKNRGRANNDWELTRQLLADRGVDMSLAEVTQRFQDLYLGKPGQPGLAEKELLLAGPSFLAALASRFPLAVVTGRPRAEAAAFLQRFGITDLFAEVICMEDAPAKPDPAPVQLALQRLGVERAWLLGDTPDDVNAARAAGVLPIGICADGPPAAPEPEALLKSGAAALLERATDLKEYLT